jgi:hypothetical protein
LFKRELFLQVVENEVWSVGVVLYEELQQKGMYHLLKAKLRE